MIIHYNHTVFRDEAFLHSLVEWKRWSKGLGKRLFDLTLASVGLLFLFPVVLIIAVIIFWDDGHPVFFVQERIGKSGKPFRLLKFRTMRVDKLACQGSFDPGDDSRVTRVGACLRKYKLDELPQLLNVVRGEMSLVGPRPEVRKWVAAFPERWNKVLQVVPGITDNASVRFRNEEELLRQSDDPEKFYREVVLPQKLCLYEDYVDHHSVHGDILLIFKTIYCCLFK